MYLVTFAGEVSSVSAARTKLPFATTAAKTSNARRRSMPPSFRKAERLTSTKHFFRMLSRVTVVPDFGGSNEGPRPHGHTEGQGRHHHRRRRRDRSGGRARVRWRRGEGP